MKFKKPKFWDLKKPNLFSYLLLPLTIITIINNFFLNKKTKKNVNLIKTVCLGNLYLGGTGKTPTAIKLYEILKSLNFNVAVGKKFYPSHIDEKNILERKAKLIISSSRKKIIERAIKNHQDILIFDDGLQDKNISYDLQIVCFDSDNWIGNGQLIPSGPLREKISSLKKYDAVFLKHSAELKNNIQDLIKDTNRDIKIFNTFIKINNLNRFDLKEKYLIFSGIGNPDSFKKTLINYKFDIIDEMIFPDHHKYQKKDIEFIKKRAKNLQAKIITTEKDFVKISEIDNHNIDFVEVDLNFGDQEELKKFLKSKLYD
tara:strand:- start:1017 stop:1961 length:945 start_codon:yes stop_codon:yes gene_type:complete